MLKLRNDIDINKCEKLKDILRTNIFALKDLAERFHRISTVTF